MQSDQLEDIREKWRSAEDYNKDGDKKCDTLERLVTCPIIHFVRSNVRHTIYIESIIFEFLGNSNN